MTLAVLAASGLAISGCSQAQDTATDAGTAASDAASQAGDAAGDATDSAKDATGSGDAATGDNEAALAAIDTAIAEFSGSKAVAFDREDDGSAYDVDVADGTTLREVRVSADGSSVEKSEEDDLDSDEAEEAAAATVDMKDAIETALGEQTGTLTDVELDHEDDDKAKPLRWEIEIEDSNTDHEIYVSATDGSVLGRDT